MKTHEHAPPWTTLRASTDARAGVIARPPGPASRDLQACLCWLGCHREVKSARGVAVGIGAERALHACVWLGVEWRDERSLLFLRSMGCSCQLGGLTQFSGHTPSRCSAVVPECDWIEAHLLYIERLETFSASTA